MIQINALNWYNNKNVTICISVMHFDIMFPKTEVRKTWSFYLFIASKIINISLKIH